MPNLRNIMLKFFQILRGIASGLANNADFNLFFEWFYPDYFPIVSKSLNAYIDDDEVCIVIFKFLGELVNNRGSRFRLDAWCINGLIVFNESAKIAIQYLNTYDNLKSKIVKANIYTEKLKIIETMINILINSMNGNYLSFAVCMYFNDDTFSQIA